MTKSPARAASRRILHWVLWVWVIAGFGAYLIQFVDLIGPILAALGVGN